MTRLHLLSDLHLEGYHYTYVAPKEGVDIVMLCGDISTAKSNSRFENLLRQILQDGREAVMVAGNHEYYNDDIDRRIGELVRYETQFPGFHFLDNATKEIKGLKFAGATLWSDFTLFGTPDVHAKAAEQGISDFRVIHDGDQRMTPALMAARHRVSREFLALAASHVDIVMTHFLPSPESLDPRFTGSPLNPYFCNDLRSIIRSGPKLWQCGHTHSSHDYTYGGCRVVCNPRGYGHENPGFSSKLVITFPTPDLEVL